METLIQQETPRFPDWLREVSPTWEWGWRHLRHIQSHLARVTSGEIDRLMLFVPPRHGKSEMATIRYPAYRLECDPVMRVIVGAYNQTLAAKFSRKCRSLARGRVPLSVERAAADDWETEEGGGVRAAGVGTGVTGHGADLIIIDDPVKSREEANSEAYRERVWDWYRDDLYTRLEPGGAIVLIMTRWHDDDLAGRILESDDAENWHVVQLPAEAMPGDPLGREVGEALCPERFDEAALARIRRVLGTSYHALYQQAPQPDEGTYFQRDWFRRYRLGEQPERLSVYGASDYAVTDGDGDYTEHGVVGFDEAEDLFLLDWWSGQKTADVWIDAELALVKKHQPLAWVAEGGPIRRAIEPFLKRAQREARTYFRTEWLTSNKDKPANARGFQGLAAAGKVWIPRTEWGEALIDQLVTFPTGKYDDKTDVCGLFGRILDQVYGPRAMTTEPETESDAWGRPRVEDSWKAA